ncbi:unnamed protein product [Urochloa decumbens]|uniref:DDE Tnp4 domain-containing protein n=1 Tax=Urochloa decumbens TaxID=240449 RepID=A0ABC8W4I5_9POAL
MGTFLAPLPSPQPIFAAANDPELSSILAALLAMNEDDFGSGEPPWADESFAAADDLTTTLPAFFFDQHDPPAAMPFPAPVPLAPPPSPPVPVDDAAHHQGTPKRKRGRQATSSPSGGASTAGSRSTTRASSSRRVWVRERSTEWWDRLDSPTTCPDAEFRRAFRMSRATFSSLVDALGGAVAKEDTALRAAVPARRRVAACVWRLATAEPLREVSRRFGLGISTCHSIVLQVCRALAAVILPAAIRWPDDPAAAATGFRAASGLPGVVGAVCTTRVPIVAPRNNLAAYYDRRLTKRNQKPSYSVVVQAVSDAGGAFTNVFVGLPGSLSDAAVLGSSALCCARHGEQQRLVGGSRYPLTEWMLVPYAANARNLTWAEHEFNGRVAAARGVARGAVRRLKARWRCLQRRTEVRMQDLPSMIAACCVLHNVCERAGEGIDPELMRYDELDDEEEDDGAAAAHGAATASAAAVQARDRIAHDLVVLHGSHAIANSDMAFQSKFSEHHSLMTHPAQ